MVPLRVTPYALRYVLGGEDGLEGVHGLCLGVLCVRDGVAQWWLTVTLVGAVNASSSRH